MHSQQEGWKLVALKAMLPANVVGSLRGLSKRPSSRPAVKSLAGEG